MPSFLAKLGHLLYLPVDLIVTVLSLFIPDAAWRALWTALGRMSDRHFIVRPLTTPLRVVGVNTQPGLRDVPQLHADLRACAAAGLALPLATRVRQLQALRRAIAENEDAIKAALREDLGRPSFEALMYDILIPLHEIDTMLANIHEYAAPESRAFSLLAFPAQAYMYREPYGLSLIIDTWNFPFLLGLGPLAGSIAAGNVTLLKPSNVSQASARLIERLVQTYLDPRIVSVIGPAIPGDRETTAALLEHAWDIIFFTGSPDVGRVIMEGAAKHLTPVVLELGGKNPVFVTPDAPIDLAAKRTVWGRMMNGGQQCISPDYVLCHESVKDRFIERACHYVRQFYADEANLGRIVGAKQFDRISEMVKRSRGRVHIGGKGDRASLRFEPSVIEVSAASSALETETFGPILWVVSVASMDEAICFVNARPKPLSLYVFAGTRDGADQIVCNTSAGGVTVNGCLFHSGHSDLPFGGVGASGMGSYHGKKTFDTFTHEKPVLHKSVWRDGGVLSDPMFLYAPHPRWHERVIRALMSLA